MPLKVTRKTRKKVWKDMLDSEWNYRYWGYLYQRYDKYERNSKIFLAISSSSTVASWTFWTQIDWLWKGLSAISALLAITTPYMNWQNLMEKTLELRTGWLDAMYIYEKLWRRIETSKIDQEEIEKIIDEMVNKHKYLSTKSSGFVNNKILAKRCQQEVLESRKLS